MTKFPQWLRSFAFTISFYALTLVLSVVFLPTLLLPRKYALTFPILWTKLTPVLLRLFCGIKINFKGLENLPKKNGYIIACKHQSALETLLFHAIIPNTFYVLKRELVFIPIAGLYAPKTGCVAIDRKGGAKTMRKMFAAVKKNLDKGMNLIIFPEGTRTKPTQKIPYSPGIALLYEQCNAPVVPVALNTGYCWPKNQMRKIAGTVTIEFLPPMPAGLHRRVFLTELQKCIEEATDKLPHPYRKDEEC